MKLVLALLTALLMVATAASFVEAEYERLFTQWTSAHKKVYSANTIFSRYTIFKANLDMITSHNEKNASFTMAMNQFGDLTFAEFKERLNLKPVEYGFARRLNTASFPKRQGNGKVDWREKGAVNKIVKDQDPCQSCWAFSSSAAIAGATAIATGKLYDLSESHLVDCSWDYGNKGCFGGLMNYAFEYVIAHGGLCQAKDYPYVPVEGKCKASSCSPVAKIKGYKDIAQGNEHDLMSAIDKTVVSVAVDVTYQFQFYSSGIFDGPCSDTVNHAIAAVGYDSSKGYYIIRNSWGPTWGEGGYMRMAIGKNLCGIASMASYPLV